jgi:phage baseplate assembly protein W
MAINRNIRQYSDLNFNFTKSTSTADVTKKVDEEAVKSSIIGLISTKFYERPFQPSLGCQIYSLLFENFTPTTVPVLVSTIKHVITKHEPRVNLLGVDVQNNQDRNELDIEVRFKLINSPKPLTLKTSISRVR